MAKWTPWFESAHWIGLKTPLKSKLTIVGRCRGWDTEKCRNRRRFLLYFKNQRGYGKLEATIRFSALNMSNYPRERRSNRSWRSLVSGFKNTSKIAEIGGVFYYTPTTRSDMANPRAAVASARRIGPTTLWNCVLIVVGGAWSVDLKIHRKSRKSEAFFIISQQPGAIWQIWDHHSIQRVK